MRQQFGSIYIVRCSQQKRTRNCHGNEAASFEYANTLIIVCFYFLIIPAHDTVLDFSYVASGLLLLFYTLGPALEGQFNNPNQ